MYLKRLLAINMAALAAMGTLLLGMGQRDMTLPFAMLVAAVASVWLSDITGWFKLNRTVTNVVVLLAVLIFLTQWFRPTTADQALSIAKLLACVQIILLFQEKDFRTWWDLVILSFLQVCVAATSSQEILFGGLLILYLFLGLSALALLFLHHERTHYRKVSRTPVVAGFSASRAVRAKQDWGRVGKIALATLLVGPMSLFLRYRNSARKTDQAAPAPAPDRGRGRWPLAGEVATFTSTAAGAGGRAGAGWELWFRLGRMVLGTLVLTAVIFAIVPRLGQSGSLLPRFSSLGWGGGRSDPLRTVGFSDTVRLGELGMVIENPEEVLRVEFRDGVTGEHYPIQGEIYLRGVVLTHYEEAKWQYQPSRPGFRPQPLYARDVPDGGMVLQIITVEPMDCEELFYVWPFVRLRSNRGVTFDRGDQRLRRSNRARYQRFEYLLGTTAFVDGRQADLVSAAAPVDVEPFVQFPVSSLPRLKTLADGWIGTSGIPEDDPIGRARFLESQLRDSGRFTYSLQPAERDYSIDPIEDFLTIHPSGHCEYFGTALTMMLRSQGIPARMIVGFKTGEYDPWENFYQVRQLDAHVWVEAYIAPQYLPDDPASSSSTSAQPDGDWTHGAWLRLDATPMAVASGTTVAALVDGVESWIDWLRAVWSSNVTGMNATRQRAVVYDPLKAFLKTLGRDLVDPRWWRGLWSDARRLPTLLGEFFTSGRWFSWRGGLAAAVGAVVLYLTYRGLRLLLRLAWFVLSFRRGSAARRRRATVEFYRRLEVLLGRHGLVRSDSQTHREFAEEARQRMALGAQSGDCAPLPGLVVEAFYHVRFGKEALDNPRAEAVEQALRRLEQLDGRNKP